MYKCPNCDFTSEVAGTCPNCEVELVLADGNQASSSDSANEDVADSSM